MKLLLQSWPPYQAWKLSGGIETITLLGRGAIGSSSTVIHTREGGFEGLGHLISALQMASIDLEERLYDDEVSAVKQWWADSRWRYTRRPFTAEQIVAKRGNLKIDYPSNAQSKKLWKILESRFKVGEHAQSDIPFLNLSID